jgi:hypothetical protein
MSSNGRMDHEGNPVRLRLRALRQLQRRGIKPHVGPGVECTGTLMGERLGIAAIYAGRGEQADGAACALLAVAGITDNHDNRVAVLRSIDQIAGAVRAAIDGGLH